MTDRQARLIAMPLVIAAGALCLNAHSLGALKELIGFPLTAFGTLGFVVEYILSLRR